MKWALNPNMVATIPAPVPISVIRRVRVETCITGYGNRAFRVVQVF